MVVLCAAAILVSVPKQNDAVEASCSVRSRRRFSCRTVHDAYSQCFPRAFRRKNFRHLVHCRDHANFRRIVEAPSTRHIPVILASSFRHEFKRLHAHRCCDWRRFPAHGGAEPQVAEPRSDRLQHDDVWRKDDPLGFLDSIPRAVRSKLPADAHDRQPSRAHCDGRACVWNCLSAAEKTDEMGFSVPSNPFALVHPGSYGQ